MSAGQTVAVNRVGAERAGVGISAYFLLVDAATGSAPSVIGALVGPLGYREALLVGAAVSCLGLVGMLVLQRRLAHRPRVAGRRHPPAQARRPRYRFSGRPVLP